MMRIRTGSRLHFGIFALPTANEPGRRQFGGVGLMIDRPGIDLTVSRAKEWSAHGPLGERALQLGRTYCRAAGIEAAFHVQLTSAAPEHAGLGTGTQLGLAVARAIAELTQQPQRDAVTLAQQVGRGLRSALGVHGFQQGGFLVEAGKLPAQAVSPLVARHDFPADWRILLITPAGLPATHGQREIEAFRALAHRPGDEHRTESLCRLVLLEMLPALVEHDLPRFGEAVFDFNRSVGAMFQPVQNGIYAHPRIETIVKTIRDMGVRGVGQSSWGPTVFAVIESPRLSEICERLVRDGFAPDDMLQTTACNHGAVLSTEY